MAHFLAHLYLILLTVDLLQKSPSPRLVVVSSMLLKAGVYLYFTMKVMSPPPLLEIIFFRLSR